MISVVIAVILIGAGIIGAYLAFQNFKSKKKQKSLIGSILAGVCALMLLIVPMSFHTVEAGEIAVVKNLGKAEKVRTAGTYFDLWITKTYSIYDAKVQNLEVKTQAYSKDAQTMDVAMTVQYQIDANKAIEIVKESVSLDSPFYLNEDGVVIYFGPYELAPYAAGFVEILVPYEELELFVPIDN